MSFVWQYQIYTMRGTVSCVCPSYPENIRRFTWCEVQFAVFDHHTPKTFVDLQNYMQHKDDRSIKCITGGRDRPAISLFNLETISSNLVTSILNLETISSNLTSPTRNLETFNPNKYLTFLMACPWWLNRKKKILNDDATDFVINADRVATLIKCPRVK